MSTKKKATKRRVRDAATPYVRIAGGYLRGKVEFAVSPIGKADTTSFILSWWQIRDMLRDLRAINEHAAKQLEQEAKFVRGTLEP